MDLAAPSTAGAYSSYPNISEGKRFSSVDGDMLLIVVLPKQNSFVWYTHNTLFTPSHVESLMWRPTLKSKKNERMTEWV